MKVSLFPFQKRALYSLMRESFEARESYIKNHVQQVVSYTAPTGAGKTIIMASLVENILFGDEEHIEQPEAIFIWLSDMPQLNEQSRLKFDLFADKIRLDQCVTITDDSFDQELLDDGKIYFLNTQKLGKNSNLTIRGDKRQYTIWETLSNTISEKSDHLYFIIDEAHRGMQGTKAAHATTIMQKFIKGSKVDGLPPMPIVVGMTATPERFNNLVSGIQSSTVRYVTTTADEVRSSGLLKDRIIITYPEDTSTNKEMAVLQAATDEWKQKWEHWSQYCYEQHYAYINPVFVIQVLNGNDNKISNTDLDECLKKIEERTKEKYERGEVVHTFGQNDTSIVINGLEVPYVEPSRIADDRNIKIVFFKENLSTGWDCPRAETMMSFRHANDATYIAQLLGRMVRTPMQMHIQVDDYLNDVHLYLPFFDADNVNKVVDELQSSEGGDIPTEITSETIENPHTEILSLHPTNEQKRTYVPQIKPKDPNEITLDDILAGRVDSNDEKNQVEKKIDTTLYDTDKGTHSRSFDDDNRTDIIDSVNDDETKEENVSKKIEDKINRDDIVKSLNDLGLLSYDVRKVKINNYLTSMFSFARLLTMTGIDENISNIIINTIVDTIRKYIDYLKKEDLYSQRVNTILQFKLKSKIFNVYGDEYDDSELTLFSSTNTDLDRQLRIAEKTLGSEGICNEYGRRYYNSDKPDEYKIDLIIYADDEECVLRLHKYAEEQFHKMNTKYRQKFARVDEKFRKKYDEIVSNGDIVSEHNFRLPEKIFMDKSKTGDRYYDHLFVNDDGYVEIDLNGWEQKVLENERKRNDFVCWLRNAPRKYWALCIPYEQNGEIKKSYPDMIIVRKVGGEYVFDILEPHAGNLTDNLGKAKGFAKYAQNNMGIGRVQLIRLINNRIVRLDMSRSDLVNRIRQAMTNDEIDHIFDEEGKFDRF